MIRVDPSDVPCASRRSILPKINRPGTMISPPPTPNSPASKPAPSPMAIATPVVTCPAVGTETAAAFIPPTLRVLPPTPTPVPKMEQMSRWARHLLHFRQGRLVTGGDGREAWATRRR